MSSGPQTWRLILAKETATSSASFSSIDSPWSAQDIGEITNATDRQFSFKLNQPQNVSFNIPLDDALADDIVALTNDAVSIPIIKLYRSTTLMMVCEIVTAEISSQGQIATLAIVATETMWNRLTKRIIAPSKSSVGYRIGSTADRTADVRAQLIRINEEPVNLLPAYGLGTTFSDPGAGLANWSHGTAFIWTNGPGPPAASLTRTTVWTDHEDGALLMVGQKDNTATSRTMFAGTPSTGANMITVTPGTVYSMRLNCAAVSAGDATASGGVNLAVAWYQNDSGTASAITASSSQPLQTVGATETTLAATFLAPSDATRARVTFGLTTSTALDVVRYRFDNVSFGPAPQTGVAAGSAAAFTGDIFVGGPWYYKPFMEFVQEAALTVGGFDFWQAPLDPVTNNGTSGTFTVGNAGGVWGSVRSFKGQARDNVIFEYGTGKHNVTEYRFTLSADGLINVAYALPPGFPSGGAGTVSAADSTGTARQRAREEVIATDLQDTAARQQLVNEHVRIRQRYKRVFSFVPQVEDGTRTPRFGVDYEIGDWIKSRVKDYNDLILDATVRVYGADIEIDNTGFVKTTLTLVQEV